MAAKSAHPTEDLPPFFYDRNLPSLSERSILCAVLRQEGITQPAISRQTGMPQQSVSRHVKNLLDEEILDQVERQSHGRRGQPGMAVRIAPDFCYSFGVAMMTDALSLALMNFAGEVVEQQHFNLPAMTRKAVTETLDEAINASLQSSSISAEKILGIGVGISGYCLDGKSRFNTPRLLDEWALVDIDDILSQAIGFPVLVDNDGNASALGESLYGHGRQYSNFVYVYVAAGIGGGVVVNHELFRGSNGNGGELGLILPSHLHALPTLDLLRTMVEADGVQIEGISDLLEKYDDDWPSVDKWVARTSESFSVICSSIAALLDVDAIVFGGRLPPNLGRKIIPHIEIYDDARRAEPRPMPRLLISNVDGDTCAIGAASLPFKKYFFNER